VFLGGLAKAQEGNGSDLYGAELVDRVYVMMWSTKVAVAF
jgi:hypothetical protein